MAEVTAATHPGYSSKGYRGYVLAVLLLIYVFNVVDRILIAVLQERIKGELHLSDFQLGLLSGPAFAVLYALLGVPIARYAERHNRITIVALGAAVWSAATAVCGFAQNYLQLIVARVWVGIGEAACVAPSHSVLSDYFPANRRASALAIYSLAIPIGSVVAAFGGGWIAQHMSWRASFWVLGALGVGAALLLKLTVKEPPRTISQAQPSSFGVALKTLLAKGSFVNMALGGAFVSIFLVALTMFQVSYWVRTYALEISVAGAAYGILIGIGATIGTFAGGFLGDRLVARRPRVLSWLPVAGLVVAIPAYLVAFEQDSFPAAFGLMMVAIIFQYLYFAPMVAVTQSVAEPPMRATASALLLLLLTLLGFGLGPPLVGALADYFTAGRLAEAGLTSEACMATPSLGPCAAAGAHGLRYALMGSLIFLVIAAVNFLLAGRTIVRDRVA
jgi:MFS family permease